MAIKNKAGCRSQRKALQYLRDSTVHTGKHIACRPSRSGADTQVCICVCGEYRWMLSIPPVGQSEFNLRSSLASDKGHINVGQVRQLEGNFS